MKYISKIFFVAIILSLTLSGRAFASNITISPAIIDKTVDPGNFYSFSISVTNHDSSEENLFYTDAHNIKDVTEFGEPIFADEVGEKTIYEMASWINISPHPTRIKGGETKEIPFLITVPKDATPGWHTAAIFVGNRPNAKVGSNLSSVEYETAVIISFRVSGMVLDELQINKFSTGRYIFSEPSVDFEISLENTGNALQRPVGTVSVADFYDQNVATISVNDKQSAVVPGNRRTLTESWKGDKWSFGRYKATLALSYGAEKSYKTAVRATYFWVLPGRIIVTVLGILAFIVLFIFMFVKLYIRRKIDSINNRSTIKTASKISRLAVMTMISLLFSLIFLIALFIIFAR